MARPRVAVDAAVLATPVWVDRLREAHVRRVVVRDDRARALDGHLRLEGDAFSLGCLLLRRPAVVEGLARLVFEPPLQKRARPAKMGLSHRQMLPPYCTNEQ